MIRGVCGVHVPLVSNAGDSQTHAKCMAFFRSNESARLRFLMDQERHDLLKLRFDEPKGQMEALEKWL